MKTMLAAVLRDFNKLELEDIPRPTPEDPLSVVVRIKSCGICQTDYKAVKGIRRNVAFPLVPGHEPSGVVEAVGSAVRDFKEGDEVIVCPGGYCGVCPDCRVGNTHYCKRAFSTGGDGMDDVWPGAFAEYMRTRECSLYHKPQGLSWDAAALTEPLSGAWKGLIQYSELEVGEDVVVIGAGGIGMLCVAVARAAGAGRLVAIDPSAFARKNALRMGATHVIDPSEGSARDQVYGLLPRGPDLVVEAAGVIGAVRLMVDLRRRGTRLNLFGITTHESFELDGGLTHFLEGRMDASFATTPLAMTRAIRLMETGLVDAEKIVSHRFPLQKIDQAMAVMSSPDRNKVVIQP
jgi:L-iditol 2-dehydrogenase